jgi:hypothetical protein
MGRWQARPPAGLLVAAAVLALAGGAFFLLRPERSEIPPTPSTIDLATIDLAATDALQIDGLDPLVAAADCVFGGRVTSTERGRTLGDRDASVVSRLVTIDIVEPLAGPCRGEIVLEEEGWLPDGSVVTVNGWVGSEAGDVGVWFLVQGPDAELMPYAATVATTGALRWRNGVSLVPSTAAPWVRDAVHGGPDELRQRLR